MARRYALSLLIFLLVLAGLATVHGALVALSLPLILYGALGVWRSPDELRLQVERELSLEHVAPGTSVRVKVAITNLGSDLEEVDIEDVIPAAL